MRIDAHQHFWEPDRFPYPWMPPQLRARYLPEDLAPILTRNRFDGSVAVQAAATLDETHWLLDLAERHPMVLGVVGWVDLADPALGHTLDQLQRQPGFKGVRHPVQDEPDPAWLLRDDVLRGLAELARRDLPYDLLLRPPHLSGVPRLAERVPGLRLVIDHMAKPERFDGWAEDIARLARIPQLCVKLSGHYADPRPYASHLLEIFGPDRLMFGSDWPVCLLAVDRWKQVLAGFTQALGALPIDVREKIFGETAARFYGLSK